MTVYFKTTTIYENGSTHERWDEGIAATAGHVADTISDALRRRRDDSLRIVKIEIDPDAPKEEMPK